MPVSKHRRGNQTRRRTPEPAPVVSRQTIGTIDELRQAIAEPALAFPARAELAWFWWYQQMLLKVGDRPADLRFTKQDRRTAALLLCVAMDGENGSNDDLAPVLADMLRPYIGALSFAEAWEQAKRLPAGSVRAKAARALGQAVTPPA